MIASSDVALAILAAAGVLAGLFLLVRGFIGYRAAGRITFTDAPVSQQRHRHSFGEQSRHTHTVAVDELLHQDRLPLRQS